MYSFITADKKIISNMRDMTSETTLTEFSSLKISDLKNTLLTFVTVNIMSLFSSFHYVKRNIVIIIMCDHKTLN